MQRLSPNDETRERWIQARLKARLHPANFDRYGAGLLRQLRREYANVQLNRAVKRGDLVKPSECAECGHCPPTTSDIHGHHPDYDVPLWVEWLCAKCHQAKHKGRPD